MEGRRPVLSKIRVFTSPSAPWEGNSWPLRAKFTPAAFPARTTISRAARTEVWAGAMSVSWTTGWPSAVTAIQEFSEARITRVSLATGLGTGGLAEAASVSGCVASSFAAEALAALAVAEEDVELWEEIDGEPGWAAALATGGTGDDMRDDAAAFPVASLLGADARVSTVESGAVDRDETLAAAGLALLARALRE